MAKLFGASGATSYAKYRPTYPSQVYDLLLRRLLPAQRTCAVDVACGSGQATLPLAEAFQHVIALDGSEQQLAQAPQRQNVEWRKADVHATGLSSCSADAVCCAQALHWFDIPRFYQEARRLLRPHGVLAVWGYALGTLVSTDHPANAVLQRMFDGTLGRYWAPERRILDNMYRGVEPTGEDFGQVERHELAMTDTLSVEGVVGYVKSWSSYNTYRAQHPEDPDPLVAFQRDLLAALGTQDPSTQLQVVTPLVMLLGMQPRSVPDSTRPASA